MLEHLDREALARQGQSPVAPSDQGPDVDVASAGRFTLACDSLAKP
jgi:hypothetical protein